MVLQLIDISKSFGIDEILNDVSLKLEDRERIGIIGKNGCGKSTLLKIISKEETYDKGNIIIAKGARIGYLKQVDSDMHKNTIWEEMMSVFSSVSALEEEMRNIEKELGKTTDEAEHERLLKSYATKSEQFEKNDGFTIKAKIDTVLNGMGFGSFDKNMEISRLSGGEKTKLSLAKLLLAEPEILLLDEPTNHLDFKTMQWLEDYLKSYRGAIVAVSHDRYFLDSLFTSIYEISNCKCTHYVGNYSKYLEQKEKNYEIELKTYEHQQKEIKKLEEYVAKNLVRASTTKMAQSRQKMIERIEVVDKPQSEKEFRGFKFEKEFASYKDVLTIENLTLKIDSDIKKILCKNVSFDVKRGEKVALVGDNGVGKSTLIKTILGLHKDYDGEFEIGRNVEISYYDQDLKTVDDNKTVFDEVYDKNPTLTETQIRTLLGSINFSDDDIYKKVSMLSGGERAKLAFLTIMLEKRNTLFLDEPTNHLDLPAKEKLDLSLKNFDGTVFFVSHDRYFLNKVATKIVELTSDGVRSFDGNYDYYLEKKDVESTVSNKPSEKKTNSYQEEKRLLGLKRSLEKKISKTEEEIAILEEKNTLLNEELVTNATDYEKCNEIYKEIEKNNETIMELYEEFEKYENELGNL
ncbi:MAG: ABC-F family ATP-binding cassette domain-containing protein [Ruminococcaceae bacterium]|nr:ABC-F family ATP-binding cassette domain-containing protein [Oscillospiraceae bacterium]